MSARLRSLLYPRELSPRGASMGRDASPPGWCNPRLMRVHAMPIDAGGYDPGGAYWGGPSPSAGRMWTAHGQDGDRFAVAHCRARTKAEAVARFAERYPEARIY